MSLASALACSGSAFKEGDARACGDSRCAADDEPPLASQAGRSSSPGGGTVLPSPTTGGSVPSASGGGAVGGGGKLNSGAGGDSAGSPELSRAGQGGESGVGEGPGFPVTKVLDDFNRLGAGIGMHWIGAVEKYSLNEQALWCEFCGGAALWSTPFGAEQEVFATYAGFDPNAMEINLVLKAQLVSDCELIEVLYSPHEGTARIAYCTEAAWTDSEKVPLMLRAGDRFGGRAHADGTIELFVNGAAVASIDASGFPHQVGRIGVNGLSGPSGNSWDDFGGGDWQ
ncbi:MAG TPA: hypothetical protein VIW29_03545 [Polyangiaceae bacterium]